MARLLSGPQFRQLGQTLFGLATGYDFGPYQDPNFLFPAWNLKPYSHSVQSAARVIEIDERGEVAEVPMGGGPSANSRPPDLERLASLGRKNAELLCYAVGPNLLHAYACSVLHSTRLVKNWTTLSLGWVENAVSEVLEYAKMTALQSASTNREQSAQIKYYLRVSKALLDSLSDPALSITEASIINNRIKALLTHMKQILHPQPLYFSRTAEDARSKSLSVTEAALLKLRQSNEPVTLRQLLTSKTISQAQAKQLAHAIRANAAALDDNESKLESQIQQIVAETIDAPAGGASTKATPLLASWLVKDASRLQMLSQSWPVLSNLDSGEVQDVLVSLEPASLTLELTEFLLQAYPRASETRRAKQLALRGEHKLSDLDQLMMMLSALIYSREVLLLHRYRLCYREALDKHLVNMQTLRAVLELLLNSTKLKVFLNVVKAEFGRDITGFALDAIADLARAESAHCESVLTRTVRKLLRSAHGSAVLVEVVRVGKWCARLAAQEVDLVMDQIDEFSNEFLAFSEMLSRLYAKSSAYYSFSGLLQFFERCKNEVQKSDEEKIALAELNLRVCEYFAAPATHAAAVVETMAALAADVEERRAALARL